MRFPFFQRKKPQQDAPADPSIALDIDPHVECGYVAYFTPPYGQTDIAAIQAGIELSVAHWLDDHSDGPLRDALAEFMRLPAYQLRVVERAETPPVPEHVGTLLDELQERSLDGATHVAFIRVFDLMKPPHFGLWTAVATACAIRSRHRGVALELPSAHPMRYRADAPLPSDTAIHVADHLVLPQSIQRGGLHWITTLGMAKFGLPNLQVKDVPPGLGTPAGNLLSALGQHMIGEVERAVEASNSAQSLRVSFGPQVSVGIDDLMLAFGGEPGRIYPNAKGSTELNLRFEDGGESGTEEMIAIAAPRGIAGGQGAWLHGVCGALFGSEDHLIGVAPDDDAMAAARRRATAEYPRIRDRFLARLTPGATMFVKYGFPIPNTRYEREFMWIAVTEIAGGVITGSLANDPRDIPTLRAGQQVRIPENQIDDWIYQDGFGSHEGGYTSEVLAQREDEE